MKEYKESYEFCPTENCWEEGGEFYDGETLARTVLMYEDETQGEPTWVDDDGHDRWDFTVEIDDDVFTDIAFGNRSGFMFGKQTVSVYVRKTMAGLGWRYEFLGYVDYDASGDSDNAKAYWDLAELLERHYETRA